VYEGVGDGSILKKFSSLVTADGEEEIRHRRGMKTSALRDSEGYRGGDGIDGRVWASDLECAVRAGFRLLLANPVQVKALHGRKSDRREAQRIGEIIQDGRLAASFVPKAERPQPRLLLRQRIRWSGSATKCITRFAICLRRRSEAVVGAERFAARAGVFYPLR